MLIPNGPPSDPTAVAAFASGLGFSLPADYVAFLEQQNGGSVSVCKVEADDVGDVLVDYIFGIGQKKVLDLQYWQSRYKQEIPDRSLLIGTDPGGNFFLLVTGDDESRGIYYYDHSHFYKRSSKHGNTYYVCDEFSTFLDAVNRPSSSC